MVWCVGLSNARGGARNLTFFTFLEEANSTIFFKVWFNLKFYNANSSMTEGLGPNAFFSLVFALSFFSLVNIYRTTFVLKIFGQ